MRVRTFIVAFINKVFHTQSRQTKKIDCTRCEKNQSKLYFFELSMFVTTLDKIDCTRCEKKSKQALFFFARLLLSLQKGSLDTTHRRDTT